MTIKSFLSLIWFRNISFVTTTTLLVRKPAKGPFTNYCQGGGGVIPALPKVPKVSPYQKGVGTVVDLTNWGGGVRHHNHKACTLPYFMAPFFINIFPSIDTYTGLSITDVSVHWWPLSEPPPWCPLSPLEASSLSQTSLDFSMMSSKTQLSSWSSYLPFWL